MGRKKLTLEERGIMGKHEGRRRVLELAIERKAESVVEIGVYRGVLATQLLRAEPVKSWIGVDPYLSGEPAKRALCLPVNPNQKEMDWLHDDVLKRTSKIAKELGKEARLIRDFSQKAHSLVEDASQDMVYVDGSHWYEDVCEDIRYWLSKVRPGGLFIGDDYFFPGVEQAVKELLPHAEVEGVRLWSVIP